MSPRLDPRERGFRTARASGLVSANGWSKLWWMRRQNYDKLGLHLALMKIFLACSKDLLKFCVQLSFLSVSRLIKHCFMLSLPKFKVVPYFIFYFDPIKTEIVLFVLIPIKYRPNFSFNFNSHSSYLHYTLRI